MSIRVLSWVWDHSERDGSELLVLLALADFSKDDGGGAFPSVSTLAAKARLSDRSVQRVLKSLRDGGDINVRNGAGPHQTNVYIVNMATQTTGRQSVTPDTSDVQGVTPVTQRGDTHVTQSVREPSEEPKDRSWAEPFDDLFEETPEFIDQRKRSRMIELGELSHLGDEDLRARAIALVDWWPANCGKKGKKRVAIVSTWSKFLSGDRPKAPVPAASKSTNGLAPRFDLSTEEGRRASNDYARGRR
jgi:hypothetical protein